MLTVQIGNTHHHNLQQYCLEDLALAWKGGEPESYEEARQVDSKLEPEYAMNEEIESPSKNTLGKKVLHNKWVYRVKEPGGSLRYKASLVVKGSNIGHQFH